MKIGSIGALIIYCVIIYVPNIPLSFMYVLTFFTGFFFTGQLMCFAAAVDMVPTSSSGLVVGFTNMIVMLSGVIFQPFVGFLLDFSHTVFEGSSSHTTTLYTLQDWKFALTSLVVCLAVAFSLVYFIKETHPKRHLSYKPKGIE
jgi:sugar phosphate permease